MNLMLDEIDREFQLIVHEQTMNLLLKLAIDFVEHLKTDQLLADFELVPVFKIRGFNSIPIQDGAVRRAEIRQAVSRLSSCGIALSRDPRVQPRRPAVAD